MVNTMDNTIEPLGKIKGDLIIGEKGIHDTFDMNVFPMFDEDIIQLRTEDEQVSLSLPYSVLKRIMKRTPGITGEALPIFNETYKKIWDTCFPFDCPDCGSIMEDWDRTGTWTCKTCKATRNSKELDQKYLSWAWEIFKMCRPREVSFIGDNVPNRGLNIGNLKYMKIHLKNMVQKMDSPFRFFITFAHLKHSKDGKMVNIKQDRTCYGLDWVGDIDAPTWQEAHKRQAKVNKFLDQMGANYHVNWSGKKGFHTWIQYPELKDLFNLPDQEIYSSEEVGNFISKMVKTFREAKLDIDTQVSGNETQLIRCPYSIHNVAPHYVCLPLTREQFDNFTPEMTTIENVYKMQLRDRGLVSF